MKVISYNLNGIRSALTKNLTGFIVLERPDILCFQETKAQKGQFDEFLFEIEGYKYNAWHSAIKKGYSGVAILSKIPPIHIEYGCGNDLIDSEGRILRMDFLNFSVMSVYLPSGTTGELRQAFKMEILDYLLDYISELRKTIPNLIICGDYNICHQAIDIHDPIGNAKSSGFLPEEREWFTNFLESGMIDTFRELNQKEIKYSWWSFRTAARERNKGWRIDYCICNKEFQNCIIDAFILNDAVHSDHCPVGLIFDESKILI